MSVSLINENTKRSNPFNDIITLVPIAKDIKEIIMSGKISKVEISSKESTWNIHIELFNVVKRKDLDIIANEMCRAIPELEKVQFFVTYKDLNISLHNLLEEYWEDILYQLECQFPLIAGIMADLKWQVDERNLNLYVMNPLAKDLLIKRGCIDIIKRAVKDYGIDAKVEVMCHDTNNLDEDLKWHDDIEKVFVKRISEVKREEKAGSPKDKPSDKHSERKSAPSGDVILGKAIKGEAVLIREISDEEKSIVIQGRIFSMDVRELRSGRKLVTFDITDMTDSISVKFFDEEKSQLLESGAIKKGIWVKVKGPVQFDKFSQELTLMAYDINVAQFTGEVRKDTAEEKRVELHLHTKMSSMDGISSVDELIKRASQWGHKAIAVTDHGVVQAFPDAYDSSNKHGIKVIYGVEGYLVDDGEPIIINPKPLKITEETYVVFDIETTGFSPHNDEIIEIGGVKVKGGQVVDKFSTFVNPQRYIPQEVQELTGIYPDMLKDAPTIEEVLPKFLEFIGDSTLVAHNAGFDTGFIRLKMNKFLKMNLTNGIIDTLRMARALIPELKNHKLNSLTKHFEVKLENHHRAKDDAEATAMVFGKLTEMITAKEVITLEDINTLTKNVQLDKLRANHIIILVKNMTGLKNLYQLITLSHLNYYYRNPRIPKSELIKYRDGLIIGSACEAGQLYRGILEGYSEEKIEDIASFYDYLEIQPVGNNDFLVREGTLSSIEDIRDINRKIVTLGEKLSKIVVATGDVHFLDPDDATYRKILMAGKGFSDADNQAPLYLKSTNEMLEEFSYLGYDKAKEVVIYNPNSIVSLIDDDIKPMPDDFFPPKIEGAEQQINDMTYESAREIYGDDLPEVVQKRIDKELNSIITNGFSVLYLIAHKLVKKSNDDGYLVGSRGSVGSSFVATMTGITEVNPLPPHYVCPNCKYSEFILDGSYGSGADLPDKDCPKCNSRFKKDGHDIPFEVFLGFKGDKVPDIDLNFSGEYQPVAHKYTEELFGTGYVFRAGTIGTIAEKTAFGFVKNYFEERNSQKRYAEMNRMVQGCTGVKRTTGQHPGGVMVVPRDMDVHDFTPLQRPADDVKSDIITTHFDYHSISGRIVKLDILGHDDPTVIKMLEDLTGVDAKTIALDDPKVLSLFSTTEAIGVTTEQIRSNTGTYAIPEFGTKFVRQMLEDTKPKTFSECVRISGFSHGTDVWLNNAQELIRSGTCKTAEAISTRDDIMVYLIYAGLEESRAFKIMEGVRKGKGVKPEDEEYMREKKVPEWYIESCKKIKYMFPKAHAVAYVMMAFRIAYFKVYYPEAFYATYFTVRADEFDADIICQGTNGILRKIEEIEQKGNNATNKEKNLLTILEVALEMYQRGFNFNRVSLEKSDATKVIIAEDGLIPPFAGLQGLGETAARNIVLARADGPFTSIEDLRIRARLSKTVIEILQNHGCLNGMDDTNQMQLFNF